MQLAGIVKNGNNEKLKNEVKARFNEHIKELILDEETASQGMELANKYRHIFN